jgi:transmembrane sensor
LRGEGYFEVAKNALMPFHVKVDHMTIEVLGTHFNVNAYSEEPDIETTLLEGSIKIKKAGKVQILSPGEQAKFTSSGIFLNKNADLQQVMAWKEGFFLFDNTDIYTLMRQVARWYDVEVNFEGKIAVEGFTGKISRNVPLSKFLKVLELNEMHIKTEGKKITIIP